MARTNSSKPVRAEQPSGEDAPNPVWFKPVMFGFMLLGLIWIIVFYVSQGALPVAALGSWNILVGFGIAFIGFLMTTSLHRVIHIIHRVVHIIHTLWMAGKRGIPDIVRNHTRVTLPNCVQRCG
jgi:hypothetical protein